MFVILLYYIIESPCIVIWIGYKVNHVYVRKVETWMIFDIFSLILFNTFFLKYSLFWGRPLQFKNIIIFKTDIKKDMK